MGGSTGTRCGGSRHSPAAGSGKSSRDGPVLVFLWIGVWTGVWTGVWIRSALHTVSTAVRVPRLLTQLGALAAAPPPTLQQQSL